VAAAHIEALLHLGALGVGISVGYIGLDRIREERDKLKEEIDKVREEMRKLFLILDIKQSDKRKLKVIFSNYKTYVLCYVAEDEIRLRWRRPLHVIHRQCYVPVLGYFRRRADLVVVTIIAIILTTCFVAFTAAALWDFATLLNSPFPEIYFFMLVASMIWIFVTVAFSYKIRKIGIVCTALFETVRKNGKQIIDDGLTSFPGGDPRVPEK
jgi:hypothetical protein